MVVNPPQGSGGKNGRGRDSQYLPRAPRKHKPFRGAAIGAREAGEMTHVPAGPLQSGVRPHSQRG